jgi:hypothetical protein
MLNVIYLKYSTSNPLYIIKCNAVNFHVGVEEDFHMYDVAISGSG